MIILLLPVIVGAAVYLMFCSLLGATTVGVILHSLLIYQATKEPTCLLSAACTGCGAGMYYSLVCGQSEGGASAFSETIALWGLSIICFIQALALKLREIILR